MLRFYCSNTLSQEALPQKWASSGDSLIKGHGRRNFVFCLFAFSLAVNFTFLLLRHFLTDLEPEPSVFQGKPKTRCSLGILQVFAAGLGKGSYSVHGLNKYCILCLSTVRKAFVGLPGSHPASQFNKYHFNLSI